MMMCIVCTSGDCCLTFVLLDFVGVNFNKILKRGPLLEKAVCKNLGVYLSKYCIANERYLGYI